jgi:hypothetical protein
MDRLIRTTVAAVALAAPAAVVGAAAPAHAGGPTPPPTLTPAPADYYTCTTNGSGTYCSGQTVVPYGPDPTGLFCGSGDSAFEVLDQAVRVIDAERWYDRDGNLVKRKRVFTFEDATLSSPTGAQVGYVQRDIQTDVYDVPGDDTLGTTYANGSMRVTVKGLGSVFVEKGRLVWGPEGNLDKEAGRHELVDYFNGDASALASLCSALGA